MSWIGDEIDRQQTDGIVSQILLGIVIGLFVFFGLMTLFIVEMV